MSAEDRRDNMITEEQLALLSLLLRHRRTYAQIAVALELSPEQAKAQAHAALCALAPKQAAALSNELSATVCDFLLGQQQRRERLPTYELLLSNPRAAAFARAVGEALAEREPDLGKRLVALLDRRSAGATAPDRDRRRLDPAKAAVVRDAASLPALRRPSFRRPRLPRLRLPPLVRLRLRPPGPRLQGLAVLAVAGGGLAGALVAAGVFNAPRPAASVSPTTPATKTTTSSSASSSSPQLLATVPMSGAGGASGQADVALVGGQLKLALEGRGLPPSGSANYVVWLYTSPTSFEAVGRAPAVGANGILGPAATELPENASSYHELIVTRETSSQPTKPSEEVLLRGQLNLKGG